MAGSSDESGTQEGVRKELVIQFCQVEAKKNNKKTYGHFEHLEEKNYSQIPLMLCHLVITSLRIRDEPISVSGQLAALKGK